MACQCRSDEGNQLVSSSAVSLTAKRLGGRNYRVVFDPQLAKTEGEPATGGSSGPDTTVCRHAGSAIAPPMAGMEKGPKTLFSRRSGTPVRSCCR